ncbi:MAG: hypothetical protein M4579_002794 [Chaenotheca gracillima]|nr:MAG: hypothetical protein M4579_002794 [Chaenotheca gracillima]
MSLENSSSPLRIPFIAAVCLTLLLIYKLFIFPYFLSPLAKIPNAHPLSPFTSLWILWVRFVHRENRTVQRAHEKFGPIVRLAPNELSINCVDEGIRTIYAGGYEKTDWYTVFRNYGDVPNMFSTLDTKPHSVRKRMLSNVYSKSFLHSSPAMNAISANVFDTRFLPMLENASRTSTPVEVHDVWEALALDIITAYIFGRSVSSDFLHEQAQFEEYLFNYYSRHEYTFYAQEIPAFTAWLQKIGIKLVPDVTSIANEKLHSRCLRWCDAARQTVIRHEKEGSIYADPANEPVVFSKLYKAMITSNDDLEYENSRLDIASELFDHLSAGFETTGIAMTYITHHLSAQPHIQRKLREELLTMPSSDKPSAKDIDTLPLLNAIIMETLRVQPSIPGAQPRITPISGASLVGCPNIPAGVRVNAQAYSLHRNPEVFPDPLEWHPERWIPNPNDSLADREAMAARYRWFWAFGSGGRMCVGKNFAMNEMKLTLAAVYSRYTTSIVDDAGIEQTDGYTAHPKNKRLVLKFDRVEEAPAH